MKLLHACFSLRDLPSFQYFLEQSQRNTNTFTTSSLRNGQSIDFSPIKGRKSFRSAPNIVVTANSTCDVNHRDNLGRTVLHLVCTATDSSVLKFLRLLLDAADIDVNAQDLENRWTALHRALYAGNVSAAVLLLKHPEINTSLKDFEGHNAFDLYNLTLDRTIISSLDDGPLHLYTWGPPASLDQVSSVHSRNSDASVVNDNENILVPKLLFIPSKEKVKAKNETREKQLNTDARFLSVSLKSVVMTRSQIWTKVLVTSESAGNLRICESGIGRRPNLQGDVCTPAPLPSFSHVILSLSLGPEHALALTTTGDVISWGSNRFAQLGYVVEGPNKDPVGKAGSQSQIFNVPRRVGGLLRVHTVIGVAACRIASACWNEQGVFTWGTNQGQLGYDKSMRPVQVLPHKVTRVPMYAHTILDVRITEHAMAWLLGNGDVWVITNDHGSKLVFPLHTFPISMHAHIYRPPHKPRKDVSISRITAGEGDGGSISRFAAVGINGEVWTWTCRTMAASSDGETVEKVKSAGRDNTPKVQRVWSLKKQGIIAKDAALNGTDGSMVVCSTSGHVFLRQQGSAVGGAMAKFQRIPGLQRIVRVSASGSGFFGALRSEPKPSMHQVTYAGLSEELNNLRPWAKLVKPEVTMGQETAILNHEKKDEDEDCVDVQTQRDVNDLKVLLELLFHDRRRCHEKEVNEGTKSQAICGGDLSVRVESGFAFLAHRVVAGARCTVLHYILSGSKTRLNLKAITIRLLNDKRDSIPCLVFTGCHALTTLVLFTYLYSDKLLAIWDWRVSGVLGPQLQEMKIDTRHIRVELQTLACLLDLHLLAGALSSPTKKAPEPSLISDMTRLFHISQGFWAEKHVEHSVLEPNVTLLLADKEVSCHSVVLQARSGFFANFFGDEAWTAKRWTSDKKITVHLQHMKWRVIERVIHFLYCGEEGEFQIIDFIDSAEDLVEFLFEIIASATELLIDPLVALCSEIVLRHVNLHNVCYILTEAAHYRLLPLVEGIYDYIAINMEYLLEGHLLEDLASDLLEDFGVFVRRQQVSQAPVQRTCRLLHEAMDRHVDWLALQDFPQPLAYFDCLGYEKFSLKRTSQKVGKHAKRSSSQNSTTTIPGSLTASSNDDIFIMDDLTAITGPSSLPHENKIGSAWKSVPISPRVDMRAVMAEAARINVAQSKSTIISSTRGLDIGERPWTKSKHHELGVPSTLTISDSTSGPSGSRLTRSPADSPSFQHSPSNTLQKEPTDQRKTSSVVPVVPAPRNLRHRQSSQPVLGPLFNPSRHPSSSPSIQRVFDGWTRSTGKAWSLPSANQLAGSPPDSFVSFVAIQQSQLEESPFTNDKRSFREIQEEEQAHRIKEDFLKWWSLEEERVKLAIQVSSQKNQSQTQDHPPRKQTTSL